MFTVLVDTINTFLLPLENQLKKYQKYIGYLIIGISFLFLGAIFSPDTVKFTGEQALNFLWFLLFLPLFARVLGLSLARTLMPLRKEIGILMGTLAFVHGAAYIFSYPAQVLDSYFWYTDGMIAYTGLGMISLLLTLPLLFTSNAWAMKKLGKNWKRLHRLAYAILIFTIAHVVILKMARHWEIGPVIVMCVYFGLKVCEWKGISFVKKLEQPRGKKWLCVPCGYIYDPALGDEDSGISPGTDFLDIPADWRCPICGVTRSDFVVWEEGMEVATHGARVISKKYLNPTTIELIIETEEIFTSVPGQFVSFSWEDSSGKFIRSYSIAEHRGRQMTFLIKLGKGGRGARLLEDLGSDARVHITGVFGTFLLKNTQKPKVFIATGTGLAPIYQMIRSLGPDIEKSLYFSVANLSDLFYLEKLHEITNLSLHIHITREAIEWYDTGRVDTDDIVASPDTEWYFCGNPAMISEGRAKLQARGYTQVFSEEF